MNMDYRLEPPSPSERENWVENKVDAWIDEMTLMIDDDADVDLYEFINVDKLRDVLYDKEDALYQDMIDGAEIEAWEAKRAMWEEDYGD